MEDRPPDPFPPSDTWPPSPPPPPPIEPPPPPVIPWEQDGAPWTNRLVETVKLLLTRPREAFERMPLSGNLLKPFVFAMLLTWLGSILHVIWNIAFRGVLPNWDKLGIERHPPQAVLFIVALFAPFAAVLVLLLAAAIQHVMLLIVGGARNGFGATLRVICYSQATDVLYLLPFCGGVLAAVGTLLLTIQGLATAHRISQGKAALAVLLPAVLCCACCIALLVTVGATFLSRFAPGMLTR